MRLRNVLVRAAVNAALDLRGEPGEPFLDRGQEQAFRAACAHVVHVHRVAPLVEYAAELGQAVDAEAVLDALVRERIAALEHEVRRARRRLVLVEAHVAVLLAEVGRAR